MDERTNADRAHWALFALIDFVDRTRVDTARDAIADLLTNLLHLARGRGLDVDGLLASASGMMKSESAEDYEGDMAGVQLAFRELLELDA